MPAYYDRDTYVYFALVSDARAMKIGISDDILRRVKTIQIYCPFDIQLLGAVAGTIALEREIHDTLDPCRIRGEWFAICDLLREVVTDYLPDDDSLIPLRRTQNRSKGFDWWLEEEDLCYRGA